MKRPLGKTLLTTSLAAALLVGGGAALLRTTAYADNTPATTTASPSATGDTSPAGSTSPAGTKHKDHGEFGMESGNVLQEAAVLLGTDEKTLVQDLRGGKTLIQLAQDGKGWNEDTLVQKLSDAISLKLDEQVKSGKLTQAKADQAKAALANRVKKVVEGKMDFRDGKRGNEKGGFELGGTGMTDLASFLKLSDTDLKTKLKGGQSLAAIAQAQGITEDQLIAHIKDGMTDKIKTFVERTHTAKPEPAANGQAPADQAPAASPAQ